MNSKQISFLDPLKRSIRPYHFLAHYQKLRDVKQNRGARFWNKENQQQVVRRSKFNVEYKRQT